MKPVLELSMDLIQGVPITRFMHLILLEALHAGATQIDFQLSDAPINAVSPENHTEPPVVGKATLSEQIQAFDGPIDLGFSEEARLQAKRRVAREESQHFIISYVGRTGLTVMAPPPRYLYEPCLNWLLNFTRHPFWKRGPVHAEIWIENPHATFLVTAEDWHRKVTLTRVEERLEPAGEPGDDDTLLPPAPCEPAARWVFRARDLPELQEVEPSQRARRWREFCHSRRMLPRTIGRALGGIWLVFFGYWAGAASAQHLLPASAPWGLFSLAGGLGAACLIAGLHQVMHLHSLRPSFREYLQSHSPNRAES